MFSGFSSYLGFNPHGSESVQTLLQKSDLVLDELLDDEGLLTELKTLNDDLLSFMKTEENYTKLINHVILEPSIEEQQLNPQRCFKFPLVCTDVLSSECTPLVMYLLDCNTNDNEDGSEEVDTCDKSKSPTSLETDQENRKAKENNDSSKYMDYLFSFLDKPDFNYTSAGYFARILNNLLDKHSSDILTYLYKKRPEQLEKLANRISSESIADILLKALTFDASSIDDSNDETYNVKRVQTLKILAQKLDAQVHQELAVNAAYIIGEVLSRTKWIHKGNEIVGCLLEQATVEDLYRILKTKDASSVSAVTTVLTKIFEHYMSAEKETENSSPFGGFEQQETKLASDIPVVVATIENVKAVVSIIAEALEGNIPLGTFRMKLIEFVGALIEAGNVDINTKIAENEFFGILLKLFLKFEWHSILHNRVEKLVIATINSDHEDLKVSLFEHGKILNIIEDAFKELDMPIPNKPEKKLRKAYVGQLVKIANRILDCEDPVVERYTDGNETWEEFSVVELDAINRVQKIQLGGLNPKLERYGSFEIQHASMMVCLQKEGQQNDQEGVPEADFRARTEECKALSLGLEDIEQSLSMKNAHLKFSQIGASEKLARRKSSRDQAEEQEIVEEVIETSSPVLIQGMKYFKFEEVIDECIEEDIQIDQGTGEEGGISRSGGPKIVGKFFCRIRLSDRLSNVKSTSAE